MSDELDSRTTGQIEHSNVQENLILERKKIWISIVGMIVAILAFCFGLFQYIENEQNIALKQKQTFETELQLEFFKMIDNERRAAFVLGLKKFKKVDPTFIAELEESLLPNISETFEIGIGDPLAANGTNAQQAEEIGIVFKLLDDLISKKILIFKNIPVRRNARTELAKALTNCSSAKCMEIVDASFQVANLSTSELYRTALGITVAISNIDGSFSDVQSDFGRIFSGLDEGTLNSFVTRFTRLSKMTEPAISDAATRVLKKFNL